MSRLIDFGRHPIAHHFLDNPDQEEYVHPVELYFCENCGLIQLVDPVPEDMFYTRYLCLSSWKYQPHISRLVKIIEDLPGFERSSLILEVGSNDGIFLNALKERGFKKILGVEPAVDASEAACKRGVLTINSYFNEKTARQLLDKYGKISLFVARQTLEHISNLNLFKGAMQALLLQGAYVLIEIPDFSSNLCNSDYTVWEEHVNYFTLETLKLFLQGAGIELIHSEKVVFSGGTLVVLGKYMGEGAVKSKFEYLKGLKTQALQYQKRWPVFRKAFLRYLSGYRKLGSKIALYGAGSRACSLINFAGLKPYIDFVVDDQPEKQRKYMPGSKLPILTTESLERGSVGLCLLAVNAECEDKVISRHRRFQENGGSFVSVLPPSERLPFFWKGFLG